MDCGILVWYFNLYVLRIQIKSSIFIQFKYYKGTYL